ncbi:uncharacterized protein [Physcomitrium patens]|uniref:uncharacterized protein n=1 Tax=Physcomitrium patens TaxID=3218 RepID=UPI003CCE2148
MHALLEQSEELSQRCCTVFGAAQSPALLLRVLPLCSMCTQLCVAPYPDAPTEKAMLVLCTRRLGRAYALDLLDAEFQPSPPLPANSLTTLSRVESQSRQVQSCSWQGIKHINFTEEGAARAYSTHLG